MIITEDHSIALTESNWDSIGLQITHSPSPVLNMWLHHSLIRTYFLSISFCLSFLLSICLLLSFSAPTPSLSLSRPLSSSSLCHAEGQLVWSSGWCCLQAVFSVYWWLWPKGHMVYLCLSHTVWCVVSDPLVKSIHPPFTPPSIQLSIHISIHPIIPPCTHPPTQPTLHPSIAHDPFIHPAIYMIYSTVYPIVKQFTIIHQSIYPTIHPFTHPPSTVFIQRLWKPLLPW